MAYHLHTGGITAFEAGIGVGVEGDRSHPSFPQLWVHLLQRGDGRLESIGLVLTPGARKGIKIVMGSCGVVAAAREALESQIVQADALPLERLETLAEALLRQAWPISTPGWPQRLSLQPTVPTVVHTPSEGSLMVSDVLR